MSIVRMNIAKAEALADSYDRATHHVSEALAELSPLVTESLALLYRPGQNPLYGPIPELQATANALREDEQDLAWRLELLRSTDAQPLDIDGRVLAFLPTTPPADSQSSQAAQDQRRLIELNDQIDTWNGSDNDPLLDALLAERRDIEARQAERARELDEQFAAFRRQEAESWNTPWTPLETAGHSLTQISEILDTAKHDRGRGVGATVADGIWSTEDLEVVIENEHGYYTAAQVAHAQTVLTMANSSPEARGHLGITQSDDGWTFTDVGHLTLDVFGLVPVVGNAADGINAAWYAAEGEYLDAALSSIALIPGLGQIVAPARQALRAAANGRVFRSLDDALTWTKAWIESTGLWRFSDEAVQSPATNAADLPRLVEQLRLEEAVSAFDELGQLSPEIIARSTPIIEGRRIGNPAVVRSLTSDGSSITEWYKYTTRSIDSPSGPFQVHFYRNSSSGAVNYDLDYKAVFN